MTILTVLILHLYFPLSDNVSWLTTFSYLYLYKGGPMTTLSQSYLVTHCINMCWSYSNKVPLSWMIWTIRGRPKTARLMFRQDRITRNQKQGRITEESQEGNSSKVVKGPRLQGWCLDKANLLRSNLKWNLSKVIQGRKSHIHAETAPGQWLWSNLFEMLSTVVLKREIFTWKSRCLQCKSNITFIWKTYTVFANIWNASLLKEC